MREPTMAERMAATVGEPVPGASEYGAPPELDSLLRRLESRAYDCGEFRDDGDDGDDPDTTYDDVYARLLAVRAELRAYFTRRPPPGA